MPLSCDCYGGCWGAHSAHWPEVSASYYRLAQKVLPYGTYVLMRDRLRVETDALIKTLLDAETRPAVAKV